MADILLTMEENHGIHFDQHIFVILLIFAGRILMVFRYSQDSMRFACVYLFMVEISHNSIYKKMGCKKIKTRRSCFKLYLQPLRKSYVLPYIDMKQQHILVLLYFCRRYMNIGIWMESLEELTLACDFSLKQTNFLICCYHQQEGKHFIDIR